MGELVQKLPDYEPLIKALIVEYYRNYDPRSAADFLTQKVGFSKLSMRNQQIMQYLELDMYHAVQNEISTVDTLEELGQVSNDASFGGAMKIIDYLHKSGITIRLALEAPSEDPLPYDMGVQEFISLAQMFDESLNKSLEKYVSAQANQYPVLLNLKLEAKKVGSTFSWYLVDGKMKNYTFEIPITLSML